MFSFKKNNLNKIKSFIRNLEEGGIEKSDKEQLIKMIWPTIGIKTKADTDKNIKVGKSKIGGKPDLPQDLIWPKVDNKSMLFCAQYNLSELTKYDKDNILPNKGFFYIFLSPDQRHKGFSGNPGFKFLYSESDKLIRTDFPEAFEVNHSFKTALIEYFEFYTIPDDENYKLFELDKKYDLHFYFHQPTEEFITEELFQDPDNLHQILGHDRSIQTSVVYEFASKQLGLYLADSSEHNKRWDDILELSKTFELLLQLDCNDPNSDLTRFGGSGTYYFGISRSDLDKKYFNDIKMSFQMT